MITLERAGPVAVVSLDRPERHNALIPELLQQLRDTLRSLHDAPGVEAMILRANGRSFSTGGDARAFAINENQARSYAEEVVGLLNGVILDLIDLPVPVIAAVHGAVTGGSIGLVLAADIVLVTADASFTPFYSVIGPTPDGGWTVLLPRLIGRQRAAAILLLNETIVAEQAVALGIAHRIVPRERIELEAHTVARSIVAGKPGSIRLTKRLLWRERSQIALELEEEMRTFVDHADSAETRDGWRAFVEQLDARKSRETLR